MVRAYPWFLLFSEFTKLEFQSMKNGRDMVSFQRKIMKSQ